MNMKISEQYESPQIEVIEVEIEQGFATSSIDGYSDDSEGNYEFGW